jgi:hypothetical protein
LATVDLVEFQYRLNSTSEATMSGSGSQQLPPEAEEVGAALRESSDKALCGMIEVRRRKDADFCKQPH